jgi:hypothetical protein
VSSSEFTAAAGSPGAGVILSPLPRGRGWREVHTGFGDGCCCWVTHFGYRVIQEYKHLAKSVAVRRAQPAVFLGTVWEGWHDTGLLSLKCGWGWTFHCLKARRRWRA